MTLVTWWHSHHVIVALDTRRWIAHCWTHGAGSPTAVPHCCTPLLYPTAVPHCCTPLMYPTAIPHCYTPLLYPTAVRSEAGSGERSQAPITHMRMHTHASRARVHTHTHFRHTRTRTRTGTGDDDVRVAVLCRAARNSRVWHLVGCNACFIVSSDDNVVGHTRSNE
jgi:hypothetical protein